MVKSVETELNYKMPNSSSPSLQYAALLEKLLYPDTIKIPKKIFSSFLVITKFGKFFWEAYRVVWFTMWSNTSSSKNSSKTSLGVSPHILSNLAQEISENILLLVINSNSRSVLFFGDELMVCHHHHPLNQVKITYLSFGKVQLGTCNWLPLRGDGMLVASFSLSAESSSVNWWVLRGSMKTSSASLVSAKASNNSFKINFLWRDEECIPMLLMWPYGHR